MSQNLIHPINLRIDNSIFLILYHRHVVSPPVAPAIRQSTVVLEHSQEQNSEADQVLPVESLPTDRQRHHPDDEGPEKINAMDTVPSRSSLDCGSVP